MEQIIESKKNPLENYGDPSVKTYEKKVAKKYKDLWGEKIKTIVFIPVK